jgi:hypothetical protein
MDNGRIQLEDGRTLPVNYCEFDHGYAITAHRSQGMTLDSVIVSADAMKQELFYVAASRGRQELAVITSEREQLRESLGVSTARPSATELIREQAQEHHTPERSPEKCHCKAFNNQNPDMRSAMGMISDRACKHGDCSLVDEYKGNLATSTAQQITVALYAAQSEDVFQLQANFACFASMLNFKVEFSPGRLDER